MLKEIEGTGQKWGPKKICICVWEDESFGPSFEDDQDNNEWKLESKGKWLTQV